MRLSHKAAKFQTQTLSKDIRRLDLDKRNGNSWDTSRIADLAKRLERLHYATANAVRAWPWLGNRHGHTQTACRARQAQNSQHQKWDGLSTAALTLIDDIARLGQRNDAVQILNATKEALSQQAEAQKSAEALSELTLTGPKSSLLVAQVKQTTATVSGHRRLSASGSPKSVFLMLIAVLSLLNHRNKGRCAPTTSSAGADFVLEA